MTAWEYCRLYPQRGLRRFTARGAAGDRLVDVAAAFYRLEQDGWELVGVQSTSHASADGAEVREVREVLTFKRAIPCAP